MGVMFFSLQPTKSAAMHSSSPENVAPRKAPIRHRPPRKAPVIS